MQLLCILRWHALVVVVVACEGTEGGIQDWEGGRDCLWELPVIQ